MMFPGPQHFQRLRDVDPTASAGARPAAILKQSLHAWPIYMIDKYEHQKIKSKAQYGSHNSEHSYPRCTFIHTF